ncbi:MAG: hypothetical protein ACRD1S_07790 [Vicinamibacterales bacterium]
MSLGRWVDADFVSRLSRHVSATIAALVGFWLTGSLAQWLVPPGPMRDVIQAVEHYVLVGLLAPLGVQLFVFLIRDFLRNLRGGGMNAFHFMAT